MTAPIELPQDVNVALVMIKGCGEIIVKSYMTMLEIDKRLAAPLDDSADEMNWVTLECLNADGAVGIRRISRMDIGTYFICPELLANRAASAGIVKAGPSRGPGVIPPRRH